MKQVVGTSLVVIAMNSTAGFAGYPGRVPVPWAFMAAFTTVAVIGKKALAVFLIGVSLLHALP